MNIAIAITATAVSAYLYIFAMEFNATPKTIIINGAVLLVTIASLLIALHAARTSKGRSTHDRELFKKFTEVMAFEPTIRTLREADFSSDYRGAALQGLHTFANEWNDPNLQYFDEKIQKKQEILFEAASKLSQDFTRETVPNDWNGDFRTVYPVNDRNNIKRPQSVINSAELLNKNSSEFVSIYNDFVNTARKRLRE